MILNEIEIRVLEKRTELVAARTWEYLKNTNPMAKTTVMPTMLKSPIIIGGRL
jgi:hypothetical protein